jgi:hypothetical protein
MSYEVHGRMVWSGLSIAVVWAAFLGYHFVLAYKHEVDRVIEEHRTAYPSSHIPLFEDHMRVVKLLHSPNIARFQSSQYSDLPHL